MEARPFINKNHKTTTIELAKKGMEAYQRPVLPVCNPDQQRKLGQLSLTDGLPVIRETPPDIAA